MCSPSTCPVPCASRVHPGEDARAVRVCVCDHDADRLAALIAEGIDQRTASLMLWAPDQLEPHLEAS